MDALTTSADVGLDPVARGATPPAHLAFLTPDFLSSALQRHFPGACVSAARCEPLVGCHGWAGSMFRVHLRGDRPELPATLILKVPPAHPVARAQLAEMGFFDHEIGFYRELAEQSPVHVPICYRAGPAPGSGEPFLLLEDLAPARNGDTVAGATVDEVASVLLALARLHARWWQDASLVDRPWLPLRTMLAPSAVTDVFEQAWPSFVRKLCIPVDDEIRAAGAWISSTLAGAAVTLFESGPRTLVHNDVQGDNLFFPEDPDRPVVLLDWQMATLGRCTIDVVDAVRRNLEPDVRRGVEAELVRDYHAALVAAGVQDYSLPQCRADYELAAVLAPARLATAVGMIDDLQPHPGSPWDILFPRLVQGSALEPAATPRTRG